VSPARPGTSLSGSDDRTVRLWGTPSGVHLRSLEGHSGAVYSVAFSPDGTHVISGSDDNSVRIWDMVSGAHLNTLEGHSSVVVSVAYSPDSTCVVSGSYDRTV
jgi:WD40 repeat protein